MSSTIIAVYALFCVLVFAAVNLMLRRRKPDALLQENGQTEPAAPALPQERMEQEPVTAAAIAADPEPPVQEEQVAIPTPERAAKQPAAAPPAFSVRAVLTVLILGMFVSILNQTVINVALPTLINEFNVSTATAQWLSTGFMLVNGILVPISAYLIQTFTYRKLFLAAMAFFTVGSVICAIAANFPIMMTGRVVQAVGAGILMPAGMNIFMTLFPPEKRGSAMGMLGIAMILAPAIGPTIAGWLVQNYTWNIMFYAMFAIGAIIFGLALRFFTLAQPLSKPKFDLPGAMLSSIGLGSLLYAFSEAGNKGWDSTEVDVTMAIGIIGLIAFIWWELTAETKLLDLTIFKIPAFSFTLFINLIITMALFGGMLLLPVYLQSIRGFTPIDSGLLLLPGSLIMGLMGPIAGKLFDKYGIRPLAVFGLILMTYGTYEFTQLSMDTSYTTILGIYVLRSFGMAFIMMPIMTAGMNALPMNKISHGTASQNTLRSVAGAIGTAILVTIMTRQTTFHTADYANALTTTDPITAGQFGHLAQVTTALAGGSAQTGNALGVMSLYGQVSKLSAINGINDAFWVATVLSGIALVLSFFLHPGNRVQRPSKKA
ncbi:DHA2 family efflux MFS transporter permease subunit [Ectobacillus ponti]|uniref:DHA2 family efflux MFS transporter permease subunit n=1 Tax=Ectobacillus ponti TaxID=2961894 RepID=A0AA42BPC2_9BACI|nr:DHA2 family efflux MFS transporter permease subunit [Ectobacillus ponti]MCP8967404.1 DHA2 family efflux MFS transporter permease subunit [Ectobacillus ponti]